MRIITIYNPYVLEDTLNTKSKTYHYCSYKPCLYIISFTPNIYNSSFSIFFFLCFISFTYSSCVISPSSILFSNHSSNVLCFLIPISMYIIDTPAILNLLYHYYRLNYMLHQTIFHYHKREYFFIYSFILCCFLAQYSIRWHA